MKMFLLILRVKNNSDTQQEVHRDSSAYSEVLFEVGLLLDISIMLRIKQFNRK